MKKRADFSTDAAALRSKAEDKLNASEVQAHPSTTEPDVLQLNHELQVHQIELEMLIEELQQAQGEMAAGLEEYTDLYDFAPVGYFTLDCQGNIRKVNLIGTRLLGVGSSRLVNGRFGFFVSSDTLPVFNLFLSRVFENRAREMCEVVLLTEAGSNISVQIQATVNENGENCRIAVTDITKIKQAENALNDERLKLENIIEGTRAGTWEWNVQTGETIFNDRWAQILGYTLDELSPISIKTWEALVHPDDLKQTYELLERHFSNELRYYDCDFRMKHKDGHWIWVNDRGRVITHTADGQPLMMFGTHIDITERKQAEEALIVFRSIFDHSNEACAISDASGRLVYVNSAHVKLFGRSLEEAQSLNYRDYYPPESIVVLDELVAPLIERGESWEGELDVFDAAGRRFPLWERADSIRDSCGRLLYGFGLMHDVTKRRQMEELLACRAERDHHIAEIFQQTVMPRHIPILPASYEIGTRYRPALQEADVCGDFYDIFDLGNGDIGICIGDIAGKGLSAALRITAAKNMIRSYAFLYNNPSKVMSLVNDALCRDIAMENDMLTAFYAVLDTQNNTLTYSNAGHEPPLMRYSDGKAEPLKCGGPMFCGMRKQHYTEGRLSFQAGDVFVMVTDGITEASMDRGSDQFGTEGIIHCLTTNASASSELIATAILEDATNFADGSLHDDAAIIVIKRVSDQ